jgi:polar amino acid transport system substrate-binding protein
MLFLKPVEMLVHKFLDKKFFKGTITQIAEQKEMLRVELERAERLKAVGVLAAGLAHEIKNPVTALKTFAEYLPQRYEDPQFRETLSKVMKSESERIERLVRNLLEFSKPSEPKKVACDMSEIVGSALDLMSGEMAKSRVVLEIQSEGDGMFTADPEQLKQAIINIILNAIEAMKPAGGKLGVFMATTRDRVELVIEDAGPGIPSDKLSHIFDPFYTDKPEGTGLGLAMTHSIVERNNGKIYVSSIEGQGARFTLSFPRHA